MSISNALRGIHSFFFRNWVRGIVSISTSLVIFLNTNGWLNPVLEFTKSKLSWLMTTLTLNLFGLPVYTWILFIIIIYWEYKNSRYINLIAGEFIDDFASGLSKWEFGGEGWKSEFEEGRPLLSVTQSNDGGISTKGFNWSDYEFSFDVKIINMNVGWIVRADNREKYLMIQLNLSSDTPKLRFHLRTPNSSKGPWIILQEDIVNDEKVKLMEWLDVRVVVLGSNIDIFICGKHSVHYFVADPIRWKEDYEDLNHNEKGEVVSYKKGERVASVNYSSGKVGFRCYGEEHAHVRNLRVKPL